jgi:hypothetical protein
MPRGPRICGASCLTYGRDTETARNCRRARDHRSRRRDRVREPGVIDRNRHSGRAGEPRRGKAGRRGHRHPLRRVGRELGRRANLSGQHAARPGADRGRPARGPVREHAVLPVLRHGGRGAAHRARPFRHVHRRQRDPLRDLPPIPPIDTWTFYRSSYTSNYLAFVPVETYSNVLVNPTASPLRATSYRVLQKLTPAERAVFEKIDKQHFTPFTDLGGKTELLGSPVSPYPLEHLTWSQLVTALRAHRGTTAEQIIGAADAITAELCVLTGNKPASACPPEIKDFIVLFQ